jgi:hypothetical protein
MRDALDVRRARHRLRILRPRDHEASAGPGARRSEQELLDRWLPVGAVGPEIPEVSVLFRPAVLDVQLGVDRAVQRPGPLRAELALEAVQCRAAGEREIKIERGDLPGLDVGRGASLQRGQRHRRVDVVKGGAAASEPQHDIHHRGSVRHIRPDDDEIRFLDIRRIHALELRGLVVEPRAAVRRLRQIAVVRVPRSIPLQEQHIMTARGEAPDEGAICRRVSVAPGRRDGQTEKHDIHAVST